MSEHTKGPWIVDPNLTYLVNRAEDNRRIAYIAPNDQAANAYLIAAAPDLLETLEEAMSMLGSRLIKDAFGYEWHEKAVAAIAKARGEA